MFTQHERMRLKLNSYPPYPDAPEEGSFDWNQAATNVAIAVVVVGGTAVILTGIGAAAMGASGATTGSVTSQVAWGSLTGLSVSGAGMVAMDYLNGEVSDVSDYIKAAVMDELIFLTTYAAALKLAKLWKAGRLVEEMAEAYPMYWQKPNTGAFSKLKEPMTPEHVKMICDEAGIDYTGIKIRIIDDPDMLNYPYTGYTHPGGQMVDLYPKAFTNRENLVKTLGHERIHVMQKSLYGEALDSNMLSIFEDAAHGSEASWWQFCQSITGGN